VRVDPARHHVLSARVDHGCAQRGLQFLADLRDRAVVAQDVGTPGMVCIDHCTASNQDRHDVMSPSEFSEMEDRAHAFSMLGLQRFGLFG
jgi:hypothetical protein